LTRDDAIFNSADEADVYMRARLEAMAAQESKERRELLRTLSIVAALAFALGVAFGMSLAVLMIGGVA
jgi:hypothetical protein